MNLDIYFPGSSVPERVRVLLAHADPLPNGIIVYSGRFAPPQNGVLVVDQMYRVEVDRKAARIWILDVSATAVTFCGGG